MQLGSVQDIDANWTRNLQVLKNPYKGRPILLGMQVKAQGHQLGWWGWEKKSHLQLSSHGHVISRSEIQIQGKPMQSNRDLPTGATGLQGRSIALSFRRLRLYEAKPEVLYPTPSNKHTPVQATDEIFSRSLTHHVICWCLHAWLFPALPFTFPIPVHVSPAWDHHLYTQVLFPPICQEECSNLLSCLHLGPDAAV